MLRPPLLLFNFELVHESKIQYLSLFTLVMLVLLGGAVLWQAGLSLAQSSRRAYRIGGGLVLAAAAAYTLGAAWLSYWEYTQLAELF